MNCYRLRNLELEDVIVPALPIHFTREKADAIEGDPMCFWSHRRFVIKPGLDLEAPRSAFFQRKL